MIEPRTINTLEEVRELFKHQLENTEPCDGDFLKGRTVEEVAKGMQEAYIRDSLDLHEKLGYYIELTEKFTKEHAEHKGECRLFYMEKHSDTIYLKRIWEGELEQLIGLEYSDTPNTDMHIPRFNVYEEVK